MALTFTLFLVPYNFDTLNHPAATGLTYMKKNLNFIDFLAQIPWWISVTLSATFYVLLKFVVPYFETQSNLVTEAHISLGPVFAPVVALAFLTPVTFSLLMSNRKKKLHTLKEEIQSIQELSWPDFKDLVAEAYKRNGYIIMEDSTFKADPSVDFILRKSSKLYLVQCRYWQNRKLGLREVKNLFFLIHAKQAAGAFILTTGYFTNEARHYAAGRPISLLDGIELLELLAELQHNSTKKVVH